MLFLCLTQQAQVCKQGNAFFCVFSLASEESFRQLDGFVETLQKSRESMKDPSYILFIIGNQIDKTLKVSPKEAMQYAEKRGAKYFETSAWKNINIEKPFEEIVRDLRKMQANAPKPSKKKFFCC